MSDSSPLSLKRPLVWLSFAGIFLFGVSAYAQLIVSDASRSMLSVGFELIGGAIGCTSPLILAANAHRLNLRVPAERSEDRSALPDEWSRRFVMRLAYGTALLVIAIYGMFVLEHFSKI